MRLYEPNSEKVWRFILSLIKDRDEAKDVLSETLIAAFESIGKLKKEQAFLSWLFTIARRNCYKAINRRKEIAGSAEFELDEMEGTGFDPEKLADLNRLYSALDELPEEQKEAIILTAIHGFTREEAAKIMKTSTNTIKVRTYRGKQKLKEILNYSIAEVTK
jgi:RNA polymerase sigma-70 factor (ECF subfamily)